MPRRLRQPPIQYTTPRVAENLDHTDLLNIGVNTHAVIDAHIVVTDAHIADATLHFTEGSIDHTAILNIGTNSHAAIDTHIADVTLHFTEASIDHTAIMNIGSNTHAAIDTHIADATLHFTEASIDHTAIMNIGSNTHAVIDTHIADTDIHFSDAPADAQDYARNNNAWVVVSSGIADGTVTNAMLTWSGSAWVQTELIQIDSDGARIQNPSTTTPVLKFYESDGTTKVAQIQGQNATFGTILQSTVNSTHTILAGLDSTGTFTTLVDGDPDGTTELWYDGTMVLETDTQGIRMYAETGLTPVFQIMGEASGGDSAINFLEGAGAKGQVSYDATANEFYIRVVTAGENIRLFGNAGTMAELHDTGQVELFYNTNIAFATDSDGARVRDPTADLPTMSWYQDDGTTRNFYIEAHTSYTRFSSLLDGAYLWFTAEDNGGAQQTLMIFDPDGAFEFRHAGDRVFTSHAEGVAWYSPTSNDIVINMIQDDTFTHNASIEAHSTNGFLIENKVHGTNFLLRGENAAGTDRNLFLADPDADVKLYQAGVEVARTLTAAAGGMEANNTLTGAGFERVLTTGDLGGSVALDDITDVTLTTEATGDVLYKSAGDWIDTSAISIDPAGQVDILNNTVLRMRTNTLGIEIHGNLSATPESGGAQNTELQFYNNADNEIGAIGFLDVTFGDDDTLRLRNDCHGGGILFEVQNAAGSEQQALTYTEAAGFTLNHQGSIVFRTENNGISIRDASGGDTRFALRNSSDAVLGEILMSSTEMSIKNLSAGDQMVLRVRNGANTTDHEGLIIVPDGAVSIFYNDIEELITKSSGVIVNNELEITGDLNHDGTNIGFYGTTPAAVSAAYTRNATIVEDRVLLQSSAATATNNNNVLAALIADLQAIGLIA